MFVIRVPLGTGRSPYLTPDRGERIDIEGGGQGVVIDTRVIGTERKRGYTLWEVVKVWLLVDDRVGEFTITADAERTFAAPALVPVAELPASDRARVVAHCWGEAEAAYGGHELARVVAICTQALALAIDDDRRKLLCLRARAHVELHDHVAALADWESVLADNREHRAALAGRARSRLALGHRKQPPPPSDRVRHKTYGEGKIVKQLDGGKLEIEFSTGKKTLLAKFVEPA